MRLKLLFAFMLLIITSRVNAQDIIYWSGSSANGEWDWGSGCTNAAGGNWWWTTSGTGARQRPDCYASFNIIKFDNGANTTMNLNSIYDYSVNRLLFLSGTPDRTINTNGGRSLFFQNNNGNCKIENYVAYTTHTFNVNVFVNSGGNNMEINPVNGYLLFNNTITNNSDNPINIWGNQQVTFSGDIAGTPGITINQAATVVYSGISKTYSGTTTINTGTKLKISSNQTLGNIALNGGTLQVDAGVTLTITGTYTASGGIINNQGTIKFAGGNVTFPDGATIHNGTANTMSSFEAASTGVVTLNSLLRVTDAITVSSGTLLLRVNDLRLNNAILNIPAGGTFDNGGENQIINEGAGTINISGTFITRDKDGFVGSSTAIPSIIPTLNAGSTIEYGLNGNQDVQGGRSYFNLTFSNGGTKSLSSAITNSNTITGMVTIKDAAILDVENKSFGGSGTNLTMTGTSEFKTAGTGVKPDILGTYTLGIGTKITFTNVAATLESIRLDPIYYNIDIVGSSVGTNTATGTIDFQTGGTLTVKSTAIFKLSNTTGFSGGTTTAISNANNPTITLEAGSTVEYSGDNQNITPFSPSYSNLTISGTGTKSATATNISIGNDLTIKAAQLNINTGQTFVVANKVNNIGGSFNIETAGSLVQINDGVTNSGSITYTRIVPIINSTDYTYWSSPVSGQNLQTFSPNTPSNKFYSFHAAAVPENWKSEVPSSVSMEKGVGYCIYGPQLATPPTFFQATFIGVPNNGTIQTPVVFNGAVDGTSNLIGNPYPSAIDADKFLNANSGLIDGTLYFWTHNTARDANGQYNVNDYASYNKTGGINTAPDVTAAALSGSSGGYNNYIPNGKIAAGQAFFTTCKASGNVIFNNSMRFDKDSKVMDNSQFFKTRNPKSKTVATEKHRIWLDLTNTQGLFKQTLIGYITGATNQYDTSFDGISFDANVFADFYSVSQDKNLVIQGRALPFDVNDQVPLGFRTAIEGTFTININQADGLLTNQAVFIEDKLTNTTFDLKSGAYTFNTAAGTFNDRFVLRYTNKTLGTKDYESLENQVVISNKYKQIRVYSKAETIDNVVVYDLLGRKLFQKDKVDSSEIIISNLISSQQVLLVKVILKKGNEVTKKVVF
nr:T9SS sorting signal type C domain-containing protein [uncultured Flavobacterium sp.]